MEIDGAHTTRLSGGGECNKVLIVRMHTTWSQETAEMEATALRSAERSERSEQLWLLREGSAFNCCTNAWQVLWNPLS